MRGADQARYGRNGLSHKLQNGSNGIHDQHPQAIHRRCVGPANDLRPNAVHSIRARAKRCAHARTGVASRITELPRVFTPPSRRTQELRRTTPSYELIRY